jgi:hypothetical protein
MADAWVLEATGRGLPKDGRYWDAPFYLARGYFCRVLAAAGK